MKRRSAGLRSNACSGRGQACERLAAMTVDRETPLQPRVPWSSRSGLDRMVVMVTVVGGGRGVCCE